MPKLKDYIAARVLGAAGEAGKLLGITADGTVKQFEAGKLPITLPGSSVPVSLGDALGRKTSPSFHQLPIDADDLNSFVRALDTGLVVEVPYRAAPYVFSTYLNFPSNATLVGLGDGDKRPTLKTSGTEPRIFRLQAVTGVIIDGFIIDGDKTNKNSGGVATVNACADIKVRNCKFVNPKAQFGISGGSVRCLVENCQFIGSGSHGVQLDGAATSFNTVRSCYFEASAGFGIALSTGANRNLIERNWCTTNQLELIGITYECWGNRVTANHAEGTGDNGISVTGFQNTITGNVTIGCKHSGIFLYGSRNTVSGNVCKNNGQRFLTDGTSWGGIRVRPEAGGSGQENVISDNVCIDDQATPTQAWGVRMDVHAYTAWAAGQSIAIGAYRFNGLNVYVATTAGTTGATAPVHTTGTVSDGAVSWKWLWSGIGNINSQRNKTGLNIYFGNRLGDYSEGTTNANPVVATS